MQQPGHRTGSPDVTYSALHHSGSAALSGSCSLGRACPDTGSFDGGQGTEADGFLPGQSKDGARPSGGAQVLATRDCYLSIAILENVDALRRMEMSKTMEIY